MLESRHGHPWVAPDRQVRKTDPEERIRIMEAAWQHGGLGFRESFDDVLLDEESNTIMSDFIRQKIRDTVKDPETAKKLLLKIILLERKDHQSILNILKLSIVSMCI